MLFTPFGFLGQSGYNADAVEFDGSNDWMSRSGITGLSDSKTVTLSFWANRDSTGGTQNLFQLVLFSGTISRFFTVDLNSSGNLVLNGQAAGVGTVLQATSNSALTAGSWVHVLISFDLANSSNRAVYLNGSADSTNWATYSNTSMSLGSINSARIGSRPDNEPSFIYNGGLSEFWFDTSYLDLSVESNRRKFIDASNKPVNLGSNGQTPTGSSPLIYQRVVPGQNANAFLTNRGTGGDWTQNGTLTIAATNPSD